MSKISKAFQNGKAFIPFLTCGDPDLETTAAAVRAAAASGADLIELGIPFSDPTAEGPVIQAANLRALTAGTTTDKVFDLVRDLRKDVTIPLVFMTYANVLFSYGAEKFIATCQEIGIDGLILPDLPYEEKEEFLPLCRQYGVELISMIAPTSENRIAMIAKEAEGFLYLVSSHPERDQDGPGLYREGRPGKHRPALRHRLRHLHPGAGPRHGDPLRRGHRRLGHREARGPVWQGRPGGSEKVREDHEGRAALSIQ